MERDLHEVRICDDRLVDSNAFSFAQFILPHHEGKEDHERRSDAEYPIDIDVGKCHCLGLKHVIEPGDCLPMSGMSIETGTGKFRPKTADHNLELP